MKKNNSLNQGKEKKKEKNEIIIYEMYDFKKVWIIFFKPKVDW